MFIHGEVGEVLAGCHQLNVEGVQITPEGGGGAGAWRVLDSRGNFVRLPAVDGVGREARVPLQHQEPVVARQGGAQNVALVARHLSPKSIAEFSKNMSRFFLYITSF